LYEVPLSDEQLARFRVEVLTTKANLVQENVTIN